MEVMQALLKGDGQSSFAKNTTLLLQEGEAREMEAMTVLHMNKGDGETSYAKNSTVQGKIISLGKPVMEEAIVEMMMSTNKIPESVGIADLGCSSGPNALLVISEIIDIIHGKCQNHGQATPECRVFLNDLHCNDFNCIFGTLPEFYGKLKEEKGTNFGPCFISAMPGSFYGRLFPAKSMHCVHSSSSLHWLSQVPPSLESSSSSNFNAAALNKGKIYISKSSPQIVLDSYWLQFQKDFSQFLQSRSMELVPGGCMFLSFMGRSSADPTTDDSCYHWELLANALMSMAMEGLVEEEKVDSFNAPYYAPCEEELLAEVRKEGSFTVARLEAFGVEWDGGAEKRQVRTFSGESRGKKVAKTIRAVVESMLEAHFGREIMDELFVRYEDLVEDYLSKNSTKYTNLVVSLVRKDYNVNV